MPPGGSKWILSVWSSSLGRTVHARSPDVLAAALDAFAHCLQFHHDYWISFRLLRAADG
jgi:hypothetical protein